MFCGYYNFDIAYCSCYNLRLLTDCLSCKQSSDFLNSYLVKSLYCLCRLFISSLILVTYLFSLRRERIDSNFLLSVIYLKSNLNSFKGSQQVYNEVFFCCRLTFFRRVSKERQFVKLFVLLLFKLVYEQAQRHN